MANLTAINNADYPIYAHYFHALSGSETRNLFDKTNFSDTTFRNNNLSRIEKLEALETANVLKTKNDQLLVPLESTLGISTSSGIGLPLTLIGHGNAPAYFDSSAATLTLYRPQTLSYSGYGALQNELATNNIVSWSLNLNIVNELNAHNDYYQRILLFFLHYLTLKMLNGTSVTIPGGEENPIQYLVGGTQQTEGSGSEQRKFWQGGNLIDFQTALQQADTPGSDPALQKLKELKDRLNGKIDFTKFGVMGHSRGATAVSRIFEYFYNGTTAGGASSEFNVNPTLNTQINQIINLSGRPDRNTLKCIFARRKRNCCL